MAEMIKQSEGKEELLQQDTIKEDIVSMVEKIKVPMDLERIRRFVAYIYVHH